MADYNYLVIDQKTGKEKKGNITADSADDATKKLKNDGFLVLSVTEANAFTKEINISIGQSVKPRDISVFCRQFVSMINAGVTILDTLDMLAEQTENKFLAKAINDVHGDIQKGETLSDAMAKHPKAFPSIMVSMVAAGEASGRLDTAFERMATHFEKSAKMKAMIKKASVYPIIVAIVALAVVVVMLVKVIPAYQDMFDEMGTELPAITKAVVALSHSIMNGWYIYIAVIAAIVIGIKAAKKTTGGKIFFGNLARKAPVFGKLNTKTAAGDFARTLSTLIASGLPMLEALGITANTMSNYVFQQALLKAKDEIQKGIPLSEPIVECGLFPPMVGHMTRIGEETGDLEGMLNKLADYYDEEVEMATQTMMAALEPMIILVLAAIVGTLVAAIMSPMLAMYQSMDSL